MPIGTHAQRAEGEKNKEVIPFKPLVIPFKEPKIKKRAAKKKYSKPKSSNTYLMKDAGSDS